MAVLENTRLQELKKFEESIRAMAKGMLQEHIEKQDQHLVELLNKQQMAAVQEIKTFLSSQQSRSQNQPPSTSSSPITTSNQHPPNNQHQSPEFQNTQSTFADLTQT